MFCLVTYILTQLISYEFILCCTCYDKLSFKNKEMVFRKNSRGAIVLLSIFLNAIKDANINTINIQSIENKLEKEGVFF